MTKKKSSKLSTLDSELRTRALDYPGAYEDFPWGERVFKVAKKIFLFAGVQEGRFRMSVKLPQSAEAVLQFPIAERTGYGLGKAGWVTLRFGPGEAPPAEMLLAWIDESYRAIAPKKNVRALSSSREGEPTSTPHRRAAGAKSRRGS